MGLVVGVTGGIGSGKSAVTRRLEEQGITVVDADLAARVVVEKGRPALLAIAGHFGPEILLPDGSLDRAALRQKVFSDPEERVWLERLTHPLIGEEIRAQLAAATSPYVILSSPLLLETSQKDAAAVVVVVDVSERIQLERTMQRDGNSADQVERIMKVQMPRDRRLQQADFVIDNSGSLQQLQLQVDALHQQLLSRAAAAV